MKRLMLMSASLAIFAGAAYYGATGAFFSDTEASTGNTFTAGAIDLKVDNTQHYNGNVCTNTGSPEVPVYTWVGNSSYPVPGTTCDGTWTLTDLGPANHFFNFGDVKPGDQGEDTVSLHIDNNPAWACLDIGTNANNENGINEPEAAAGDVTANSSSDGELAQNVHVFGWLDNGAGGGVAGDNIWQAGEPQLFASTPLSGFDATTTLALADSTTGGGPLSATSTSYLGLYWCAGTINSSGPGNLSCDGSTMGNDTQTDSATSTVQFRVEQFRNNPNFTCGGQEVAPTTLTLAKTVLPALLHPDSAYTLVASSSITLISGIEGAGTVTGATITPGTYALSESSAFPGATAAWSCIGNATPEVDHGDGTATVTIAAGEQVGCEVTNSYPQ